MPERNKLFSSQYFPPISFFKYYFHAGSNILEIHENYQKQSYRNRCSIYSPMGKMILVVPVRHTKQERQLSSKILIAYEFDWVKDHVKSLEAAYRSSPYFEYYEDELRKIFTDRPESLHELNISALKWVLKKLDEPFNFEYTQQYEAIPQAIDLRDSIHPKKETGIKFPTYYQVFSEKHGFIPDLSILDLLFNLGPQSRQYLLQLGQ